jgi:galactoside O-acetyltransferase
MARFKRVGDDVQIFEHALILKPEVIELGDGVRIDDYCRIEGGKSIRIGDYTHISSFSSILAGGDCQIGRFVGIAQGARIITGGGFPFEDHFDVIFPMRDLYFRKAGFVQLEDYSVVCANAVVLPDIVIGTGGMVAACSVVTRDVQPWTIVAGYPATFMRNRGKPSARGKQTSRIYPYS